VSSFFVILVPWGISVLCIYFGMAWYCWHVDSSGWFAKILWTALFFFTPPFGAVAYYFIVYRTQSSLGSNGLGKRGAGAQ